MNIIRLYKKLIEKGEMYRVENYELSQLPPLIEVGACKAQVDYPKP